MDQIQLRKFAQLEFRNPQPLLKRLREVEVEVAKSGLPPKVRHLRTNPLKSLRQMREAALFCYGMGQRIGQTVFLALYESQDYDFVTFWIDDNIEHFATVQLKEVVPTDLNPTASLQRTIDSLSKYVDSEDLTVAIHLNQPCHFDPSKLLIPKLPIAALWIFSSISKDQSEWGIWGNFLDEVKGMRFAYPT